MAFTSKVLLHYAAIFGGNAETPNVVEHEPLSLERLQRNQEYAQTFYFNEILFLILAVFAAGSGLVVEIYMKVLAVIPIVIAGFVLLFVIGVVIRYHAQKRRTPKTDSSEGDT